MSTENAATAARSSTDCSPVVPIRDEDIAIELEGWRTGTSAGRQADAAGLFPNFRTAFNAGIAFACRSQTDLPCFCGHHISGCD